KWNKEQIKCLLKLLIKDQRFKDKDLNDDLKKIKKSLLRKVFPKELHLIKLSELEQIKQKNYKFMTDYFNDIQNKTEIYAITLNIGSREAKRKMFEIGYKNLLPKTKLKCVELEIDDYKTLKEKLINIEKIF